ncbi:MAG: TlpA family protein disulfide reductase [Saprospiraceae bacterium]|nr:TlpA family protein disulfide reductase [Saprospiraceae bacterium]
MIEYKIKTKYLLLILYGLIIAGFYACKRDPVKYFQREGRNILLSESEFKTQLDILQHQFKSRDSTTEVIPVFLDSLRGDTDLIIRYNFRARLPDGEELFLNAPKEGFFEFLGKKLPDFELPTLEGDLRKISDFYDKPLVLNFWFRACAPCKMEMPRLNEIRDKYQDRVNFVAICRDDMDELKGFFEYHDFDYLQLVKAEEVSEKLGIKSYPKNIVVKKGGEISQILDALLNTIDEDGNIYPGEGQELIREIEKIL